MKRGQFASVIFFLILTTTQNLYSQSENAILGTWYNTQKTAKIEILQYDSKYIGKIVWLDLGGRDPKTFLDTKNSDPELQNRPIMGLTILENLSYKDGTWEGGKIYDPESGKSYHCELKLINKKLLEVKGFLGDSWVERKVEWTKLN